MQRVAVSLARGLAGSLTVAGLAAVLAAGALALLAPERRAVAYAVGGVGLLLLLAALMGAIEAVRGFLLGRQGRYGANTIVMIVAFVGIAVLANLLVSRQNYRIDLTENQSRTLAPQTVELLRKLSQPVEATAFVTPDFPFEDGRRLLELYSRESSSFSFQMVDPQAQPSLVLAGVQAGTVVFQSGERQSLVFTATEQEFTSALIKVTSGSQLPVSFLTGHGERDIQESGPNGYSTLNRGLTQENYQVSVLNLLSAAEVPEGTAVVVVAGPTKAPLPSEALAIANYLQGGGKVLMLVDPETSPEWAELLQPWGVEILPGKVFDAGYYLNPDQGTPAILPDQYPFSPITRDLSAATFFPAAVALATPTQADGATTVTPLLRTSVQSWRQTSAEQTTPDQAPADQRGPLLIGVTVEAGAGVTSEETPARRTRLVVIGDSDFGTNQFVTAYGNGDLILNSVNWLAQQEELIGIRPTPSSDRPIFLTAQGSRWVLLATLLLLPLLPALVGVSLGWRRR